MSWMKVNSLDPEECDCDLRLWCGYYCVCVQVLFPTWYQ